MDLCISRTSLPLPLQRGNKFQNTQEKTLTNDSLQTILSMKESPKPELPQLTCPRSTHSLNHQSAGALNGSHDSGRGSWTGAGSDGSRPDS